MRLQGQFVRLEPLELAHVPAMVTAAAVDPTLYRWSMVPQGMPAMSRYVEAAISARDRGTAVPFVIVRQRDEQVIGSTRFFALERWNWPDGHPDHGRDFPDTVEIGYTWLTASAIRTAANTESKLLMLTHAFEDWQVWSVCLHTDERNEQSRRAIERVGGRFEGILRAHRLAVDFNPRNSARYSIIRAEWPTVKAALNSRLDSRPR